MVVASALRNSHLDFLAYRLHARHVQHARMPKAAGHGEGDRQWARRKYRDFSADASLHWSGRNYEARWLLGIAGQRRGAAITPAALNVRNGCQCYKSMGGPVCVCNISIPGIDVTVICDKFGCY